MIDICVDSSKLDVYRVRINSAYSRCKGISNKLQVLSNKSEDIQLHGILSKSNLWGCNNKLKKCAEFIETTVSEFNKLERELDYDKWLIDKRNICKIDENFNGFNPVLFFGENIIDTINEYKKILSNNDSNVTKYEKVVELLTSNSEYISKYKEYYEWITGKDVSLPAPIDNGVKFIKDIDTINNLVLGSSKYIKGLVAKNTDDMVDGANKLLDVIKEGVSEVPAIKGNVMGDFILDYGINMISNWIDGIDTETTVKGVYWKTFVVSALDVVGDKTLNAPTLAVAYIPAATISKVFGYDMQKEYEKISDKKGFPAVLDGISQLKTLIKENSSFDDWKSGVDYMGSCIKRWFKK